MEKTNCLYELTQQLGALQRTYNAQQNAFKVRARLELREIINECFKTLKDIGVQPASIFEKVTDKEGTQEPYLIIERESGQHLQHLKKAVTELLVHHSQLNEMTFPDDLQNRLDEYRTDIQEQKEQLKVCTFLAKNFDVILKNSVCNYLDDLNNASGEGKENL